MLRKVLFTLAILIAIAAGASAAYFALTVPNDVRSEQLLREARRALNEGNRDAARDKLEAIVKQYPRTDAAAAATFALFEMSDHDRREIARLDKQLKSLTKARTADQARIAALEARLGKAEETATQAAEAAKKAAEIKKPAPAKKPVRRTTRRRR